MFTVRVSSIVITECVNEPQKLDLERILWITFTIRPVQPEVGGGQRRCWQQMTVATAAIRSTVIWTAAVMRFSWSVG